MDITNIHSLQVLSDKMRYAAARQEIISQNISASQIPDYTRHDINPESFSDHLARSSGQLQLKTTDHMHISGNNTAVNKNSVDTKMPVELDLEALEMMRNNQDFNLANSTYKKFIALFKEAVGSGNR